jgi:hypothetical protein
MVEVAVVACKGALPPRLEVPAPIECRPPRFGPLLLFLLSLPLPLPPFALLRTPPGRAPHHLFFPPLCSAHQKITSHPSSQGFSSSYRPHPPNPANPAHKRGEATHPSGPDPEGHKGRTYPRACTAHADPPRNRPRWCGGVETHNPTHSSFLLLPLRAPRPGTG